MPDSVSIGVATLTIPTRTHLCAFFRGPAERDEIMFPFVREGLRAGDKCLCVFDAVDQHELESRLGNEIDVAHAGNSLDIMRSTDTYLGRGPFSAAGMLNFWHEWTSAALADGTFPFARIAGEMTAAISNIVGPDELFTYESELNRFVVEHPQVILCLYDLDQFSGQMFVDILRTHPKVLMGSTILDNIYYIEPDHLRPSRR
jgi:hypothetical protein